MKHIWKIKGFLLLKRRKMWWNRKGSFFKNHRNCSLRTSAKGRLFRTFHFKGGLCNRRTGYCLYRAPCLRAEQILWFLKNDPVRFHLILLFFYSSKRLLFDMWLVRSTIANLCSIMIHFNALYFSECRSKEVISFFWRSVYNLPMIFNRLMSPHLLPAFHTLLDSSM